MTNKAFGPVALLALGLTSCVRPGYNNFNPTDYAPPQAFGPQDSPAMQYYPPAGFDYDYLPGSQYYIVIPGGVWDLRRGLPRDRSGHELPPSVYAHPQQLALPPTVILRGAEGHPVIVSPPSSREAPYAGRPGITAAPQPLRVAPGRPMVEPQAGAHSEERRILPPRP